MLCVWSNSSASSWCSEKNLPVLPICAGKINFPWGKSNLLWWGWKVEIWHVGIEIMLGFNRVWLNLDSIVGGGGEEPPCT